MEKRNHFIWFLYACILCLCFSVVTASLTRLMGLPVQFYFLLTAAAAAVALLAIYLPARLMAAKWRPGTDWMFEGKKGGFSSLLIPVALTALLVCARLFFAPDTGAMEGQVWRQAVSEDVVFSPFLGDLYALLLRAAMSVLSEDAVVFGVNVALQAAGLVFFYGGIRRLEGAFCGITAALAAIFLPPFSDSAMAAEPQSLLFFFASLLIWLGGLFVSQKGTRRVLRGFLLVLVSLLCGMGILTAPLLSSIIFFWLALLAVRFRSVRTRGLAVGAALCGGLCGFCALILAGALWGGQAGSLSGRVTSLLESWLALFASRETDAILHSPSLTDYWTALAVFVPALFALFSPAPDNRRGRDFFPAWTVLLGAVAAWETLSKAPFQEQGLRFACLGIFSGMGIRNMLQTPPCPETDAGKSGRKQREKAEETEETVPGPAPSGPAPGEYLENPLPVPKRHKRREMSYGFEPRQDQMYYEIPVADSDDFDLKE